MAFQAWNFFRILHFCLKIIGKSRDASSVMFDVIHFFEAKITAWILCHFLWFFNINIWDHTSVLILINSWWPNDTTWRHRSGSTLAQVMVCGLKAPSHCLNQCRLVRNVVWPTSNFKEMLMNLIHVFDYTSKITTTSPTVQWITHFIQ